MTLLLLFDHLDGLFGKGGKYSDPFPKPNGEVVPKK